MFRPEDGSRSAVRILMVACGSELQAHLRQRLLAPHWLMREARSGAEALGMLGQEPSELVLVGRALPDLDLTEFRQLVTLQHPSVQIVDLDQEASASQDDGSGPLLRRLLEPCNVAAPVRGAGWPMRTPAAAGSGDASAESWQGIVGSSPAMQRVFRTAALVARRDTTVLIGGESGTGKDLLARAIHKSSRRAQQPFVVINCAAIPEALLEAELFGYTKGAFTGATQSRAGRVHAAQGGTLFLDEIGDMPLLLQSKILRFLEQGEVQRIGSADMLKVDCRIVAATNANLQEQVKARQFREDLYYRLAVMPLAVPPLRERMEDLPALCGRFLEVFCPGTRLHAEALAMLQEHRWPGNVRELRNVMERASLFAEGRAEVLVEDVLL